VTDLVASGRTTAATRRRARKKRGPVARPTTLSGAVLPRLVDRLVVDHGNSSRGGVAWWLVNPKSAGDSARLRARLRHPASLARLILGPGNRPRWLPMREPK
jgi:hypothetical protein